MTEPVGRPCPVPDCSERFLSVDGAGRHLDRAHDEAGRWASDRYQSVDRVDGGDVVIYETGTAGFSQICS